MKLRAAADPSSHLKLPVLAVMKQQVGEKWNRESQSK